MTNNQLTDERISDISDYFVEMQDHYSDPADRENFEIFRDAELLMKELQERRKADSEPAVYASEETLAYAAHGELLLRVLSQPAGDAIIPLYRHAQQPVVPEEKPMPNTLSMYAVDAVAAIAEVKGWNACRVAMLQAGTLTNEDTRRVDELTMWIKRLVRSLKNANPDSKLPRDAMDYLTAKGLISVGDILR